MADNKKKTHTSHKKFLAAGKDAPFDYVEAYKSLRTNMEFLASTSNVKSIVITSTVPDEGKSNVSVNLALTMASAGKRIVIIDGDLRKGSCGHFLNVRRNHPGITNLMAGTATWKDALVKLSAKKSLYVLPTGPLPPNPAELLTSPKFAQLFEELVPMVDYIIVDTPPVTMLTDAAILSRYVDGAVIVVRPGVTYIEAAKTAQKNLEAVGANILGCIVNAYDVKKSNKKDGYYYSYAYGDYNTHNIDDDDEDDDENEAPAREETRVRRTSSSSVNSSLGHKLGK